MARQFCLKKFFNSKNSKFWKKIAIFIHRSKKKKRKFPQFTAWGKPQYSLIECREIANFVYEAQKNHKSH